MTCAMSKIRFQNWSSLFKQLSKLNSKSFAAHQAKSTDQRPIVTSLSIETLYYLKAVVFNDLSFTTVTHSIGAGEQIAVLWAVRCHGKQQSCCPVCDNILFWFHFFHFISFFGRATKQLMILNVVI